MKVEDLPQDAQDQISGPRENPRPTKPSKVKMPEDRKYPIEEALGYFHAASEYYLARKVDYEAAQREADRANNRADKLSRDLREAEDVLKTWKETF